tara:strand:- start:334 stop:714 length:381 start_codon:yes stop_codon:yes gene_type:complete
MFKNRPLSPHLQIYRPQITSILSIFHRITGIALSIGSVLIVAWILTLSLGQSYYEYYSFFCKSWFGKTIFIVFTFAFNYHLSNGIRHLFWDFGYGYELKTVYKSGLVVILSACVLTTFIWIIILSN